MLTVESISDHMGLYISTKDADEYVYDFVKAVVNKTGIPESDLAAILKPITKVYQAYVVQIDTRRMPVAKDVNH